MSRIQTGFNSVFLQIPWDDARNDGQFHVYQIDLTRASNYRFTMWNIYFAFFTSPELSLQVDYIRLGTLATRSLQAELQLDGQVKVSWPASGNVTLESTSALPGGWATDPNTVTSDGIRTWVLESNVGCQVLPADPERPLGRRRGVQVRQLGGRAPGLADRAVGCLRLSGG